MAEQSAWRVSSSSFYLPQSFENSPAAGRNLARLYDFAFDLRQPGLPKLTGCYAERSISGYYREFQCYLFPASDFSRRLGQLDRGGKAAKQARRAAYMALRIRRWPDHQLVDKLGKPMEAGEVRFYDPIAKQVRKQSWQEAARWTGELLGPLRGDWRAKKKARLDVLDDIYRMHIQSSRAEDEFMEHAARVWYLLHVTDASVKAAHEVAWFEPSVPKAKLILDELAGHDIEELGVRHLRALYA